MDRCVNFGRQLYCKECVEKTKYNSTPMVLVGFHPFLDTTNRKTAIWSWNTMSRRRRMGVHSLLQTHGFIRADRQFATRSLLAVRISS